MMSGAEALAVLSLLANVAGVLDFTWKVLERAKDARDGSRGLPKTFQDVKIKLPLLNDALNITKAQVETGNLNKDSCKNIEPVLEDCISKIKELNLIIDECRPKKNAPWYEREWKAITSLKHDKKIEDISKQIWRIIQLLTYYHVVSPPAEILDPISVVALDPSERAQARSMSHFLVPDQR